MLGGVGSGKTFTGATFLLRELQRATQGDTSTGIITAISYGQLRRSVLAEVFKCMQDWNIPFSYNQMQSTLTLANKKKFFCLSVDKGSIEKIRGINAGSVFMDEACFIDGGMETYTTVAGRIRDKKGSGKTLCTSSPNGFNFMYDLYAGELHDPNNYKIVKASTKDNTFISEDFYERMAANLDEKGIKQELEGEFISRAGGQAYYAFNREIHMQDIRDRISGDLFIGMDFNFSPLCATIIRYRQGCFYIVDEIYLKEADTYMMASEIKRRGYDQGRIIADSTYSARRTSGKSDKRILEEAGLNLLKSHNPFVSDRITNVNRLLGQGRIVVDNKCKMLRQDLEQVTLKDDGSINQSGANKHLSHISDSLGYACWKLDSIAGSPKKRIFNIQR
tara:strand:+ start:21951 stop:23123 length:1173 start_codon:yes stop_codon:yes gene_type:complete